MKWLDNFIKGPITSLLGLAIMLASAYGWYIDYLTDWQGGVFGIIGFVLIRMRDEIPGWIKQLVQIVITKFSNK